jgi:hypothetical protein
MGGFSRVAIHFEDSDKKQRMAVIDRMESMGVEAIFLRGAETRFRITPVGQTNPIVPEPIDTPPEGVRLEPASQLVEGPGAVCYLVNGQLKCWSPS